VESINGQIVREFTLPAEIAQGTTTVRLYEETLQITARKSQQDQRTSWSQLVDFDARSRSPVGLDNRKNRKGAA
jgi:hypothetical protein